MLFSGIAFCLSLLAVIPAAAYPSLYRGCDLPETGWGNHKDPLEPDGWVAAPRILSTFINKYDGARIFFLLALPHFVSHMPVHAST